MSPRAIEDHMFEQRFAQPTSQTRHMPQEAPLHTERTFVYLYFHVKVLFCPPINPSFRKVEGVGSVTHYGEAQRLNQEEPADRPMMSYKKMVVKD